jgi:putative endonuclease
MANHNELGKEGENLAADYLVGRGYKILHRNWRYSYYEIDIIAIEQDKLHIIEVKTRHSEIFGYPEEDVTRRKFKRLLNAADEFLYQHPQYRHVQYDIVAITFRKPRPPEIFMLADVYL